MRKEGSKPSQKSGNSDPSPVEWGRSGMQTREWVQVQGRPVFMRIYCKVVVP